MNKFVHKKIIRENFIKIILILMILLSPFATASYGGVTERTENSISLSLLQQIRNEKITINLKNKTIKDILIAICKQGNVKYGIQDGVIISDNEKYSLDVTNVTIEQSLAKLFSQTKYDYRIEGDIILIINRVVKAVTTKSSQKISVAGKIVGEDKAPLIGASVIITGTANGAITDDKGAFSLTMNAGQELEIAFLGFITEKKIINESTSNLMITLKSDAVEIKDVVITGYYSRNKESFTGSVKSLSSAELKAVSNTNLIGAISMLTPGLNIKVNNEAGSNPNVLPELVLRGTSSLATEADIRPNQPIIMLDGIEISMRELYDLDINDIERVNVLKDASATSLYGEKAANGVIVIERKAISGDAVRVSYNFNANVLLPDLRSYDYLNAKEKLDFEMMAKVYNTDNKYEFEDYNKKMLLSSEGLDTDWLSKPVRTGRTINNSIGISGRGNGIQYRINANINNTKGIMKDDSRTTKSLSTFISYRIENKIQVSLQSSYSRVDTKDSPYGTYSEYVTLNPYDSPYDEFGNIRDELSWDVFNPLYEAQIGNFRKGRTSTFTNTLDARWDIISGLYVTAQGAVTVGEGKTSAYISPKSATVDKSLEVKKRGSLGETYSENTDYNGKFVISYNKEIFDDNILSVHIGGDITKNNAYNTTYSTVGYMNKNLFYPYFASGYPETGNPSGSNTLSARLGLFANINYTYKNRYFVDGSIRRSGSSQFGSNEKFAPFWSAGAGWNLHKENFMENSVFSTLRLRYSYGIQGSVAFSPYQAVTTYRYSNDYFYMTGIGAVPITMGNPDLTWQQTKQHNIGLNATLLNNRLDITLDYYSRLTDDMLVDLTIPPSVGINKVKGNLGRMRNNGFEFDISALIISTKDWRFNFVLNGSHNKNKILAISNGLKKFNDDNKADGASPKLLFQEGESSTAIYAVRSAGINPANGKELFIKKDGNYTELYDADDKVVVGDNTPKFEGSIMPSVSFKNFSLNISLSYRLGGQIYNTTRADKVENINPKYNVDRRAYEERWKNPNDLAKYLDISNTNDRSGVHTSRFVEDDNALEIRRIELSYEFTSNILKKIGFKRLRFGAGIDDVARFSSVKYERGTSYPFSRGFSFTISPTF